jgi:hypothetical protein
MANDNTIKTFTAFDIEKYHKGLLAPKERHALEKAALDDPFLADALEGYSTAEVNIAADLTELKNRLAEKTERSNVIPLNSAGSGGSSFRWLRVAAIIVLVAGAGFFAYKFAFTDKKENEIVQSKEQTEATKEIITTNTAPTNTTADSGVQITPGTTGNKNNNNLVNEQVSGSVTSTNTAPVKDVTSKGETKSDISNSVTNPSSPAYYYDTDKKDTRAADNDVAIQPSTTAPTKPEEKFNKSAELAKKQKEEADYAMKEVAASQNQNAESRNRAAAPVTTNNNNRARNDNYYKTMNTFRGRVTDANNNGVPFANVTNTEDNVGTYSDARGFFNLTSPDSVLNVQVRSVGFDNRNLPLQNVQNYNQVVLQEDRNIAMQTISNKKINAERRQLNNTMKLEEPEPEDGWDNYDSYLTNNLNVPEDYKMKQTSGGQVEVSFEVNKYGEPVNFKIEKSLCSRCDQEAIRLIKEGPKWRRKAKKGRTTVTIAF